MPAFRQNAGFAQRRLAHEDRDRRPVREILRRRSLAALPQCDVLVVEDHRAAARRDLGKSIRQSNLTDVHWVGGIDVLVQYPRNLGQNISPREKMPRRGRFGQGRERLHRGLDGQDPSGKGNGLERT